MNKAHSSAGFIKALTLIVVGVCVIFIVFIFFAKGFNPTSSIGSFRLNPIDQGTNAVNPLLNFGDMDSTIDSGTRRSIPNTDGIRTSAYAGVVTLGNGNASYSAQPFEEYVTIQNSSGDSVDITGWVLVNSKGTRPVQNSGNSYFYPTADSAVIPQGTEFLDPSGVFSMSDIILRSGDRAIVTTGGPFSQYPFSIKTSFRENICDGYLKNYPFEPSLGAMCPYPSNDPQIRTVTDECYDYMQSLSRCKDPERDDKAGFDKQTSQCKNFMRVRLNYPSCVANHKDNPGFKENYWRVFLGKKVQLWAAQRETITLYDRTGNIVDQVTY